MADIDISMSVLDDPYMEEFVLLTRQSQFANVTRPTIDQTQAASLPGATFTVVGTFPGRPPLNFQTSFSDNSLFISATSNALRPYRGLKGRYYVKQTLNGASTRLWTGNCTVKGEDEE
jgi:hypothetical protein